MEYYNFKKITLSLLVLLNSIIVFAQKNGVGIEAAGNTGYSSIYYHRDLLYINPKQYLNTEIGFGLLHIKDQDEKFNPDFAIPVILKYNFILHPKHEIFIGSGFQYNTYNDINEHLSIERKHELHWINNLGYQFNFNQKWELQAYGILNYKSEYQPWFGAKIMYRW